MTPLPPIISFYAARWKIEAAFKELKFDLGSIHCQANTFTAVTNHWHFAMMAMSPTTPHC
ncbi:MAG: transposase [Pseudomonadota bacterium]